MTAVIATPPDPTLPTTTPAVAAEPARTAPGDFDLLIALLQTMVAAPGVMPAATPAAAVVAPADAATDDDARATPETAPDASAAASTALMLALAMNGPRGMPDAAAPSAPTPMFAMPEMPAMPTDASQIGRAHV